MVVLFEHSLGIDELRLDQITKLENDTALVEDSQLHDVRLLVWREYDVVQQLLLSGQGHKLLYKVLVIRKDSGLHEVHVLLKDVAKLAIIYQNLLVRVDVVLELQ